MVHSIGGGGYCVECKSTENQVEAVRTCLRSRMENSRLHGKMSLARLGHRAVRVMSIMWVSDTDDEACTPPEGLWQEDREMFVVSERGIEGG